ncbi:MAG: hypothetical protein HUJ91_06925 [Bacteroidales bacterium]|nr:hypothetical protein [Bacteroidales bacterium]
MKYLVRSLKYLCYFALFFIIIVLILSLLQNRNISDFQSMFVPGSLWKIALIFAGVSAVYPAVSYRKYKMVLEDDFEKYHDTILATMKAADYRLESEQEGEMVFRSDRAAIRLSRIWEDTITFSLKDSRLVLIDGPFRDTSRIARSVQYNFRHGTI